MAWLTVLVSLGLLLGLFRFVAGGGSPRHSASGPPASSAPGVKGFAVVVIPSGGKRRPPRRFPLLLFSHRVIAPGHKVQDHQLSVMFLVDVSGSMKRVPLADMENALARFLKAGGAPARPVRSHLLRRLRTGSAVAVARQDQ